MSRPTEVSLEQRRANLDEANRVLVEKSEAWCEAHIVRVGRERADEELNRAEQAYKRAARALEETRKRLERQA